MTSSLEDRERLKVAMPVVYNGFGSTTDFCLTCALELLLDF